MAGFANVAALGSQAPTATEIADFVTTMSFTTSSAISSSWKTCMTPSSAPVEQISVVPTMTSNSILASTYGGSTHPTDQPPVPASSLTLTATAHTKPPRLSYSTHVDDNRVDKSSMISLHPNLSMEEVEYLNLRKLRADGHLQDWIGHVFGKEIKHKLDPSNTPTLGLATSGGGVRSLLTSAGVLESLSHPETRSSLNLYDAITLFSAVSTTSWLPFIMIRDNYSLREYVDGVLMPQLEKNLLPFIDSLPTSQKQQVQQDLTNRAQSTDHKPSMSSIDLWSRVLAYKLLSGPPEQDNISQTKLSGITLSGLVNEYNYPNGGQPLPVLNMLTLMKEACMPTENEMPFEVTPFRSGTWAAEDNSSPFMFKTRYLDTQMNEVGPLPYGDSLVDNSNFRPVVGWDDLGLLTGIASFPIDMVNCQTNCELSPETYHEWIVNNTDPATPPYARLNNPFFMQKSFLGKHSQLVQERILRFVDGSTARHGIPLLPLLHPQRHVDVVIAIDSTSGRDNYPDGSQMLAAAKLASRLKSYKGKVPETPITTGMWRYQMPDHRAIVFGCYEPNATTVIYLPNANMGTFLSNTPETKWKYNKTETASMFENGISVGEQGNQREWYKCMGCFILKKTALVFDDKCGKCWNDFCYKRLDDTKQNVLEPRVWRQPADRFERKVLPPQVNAGSWSKPAVTALVLLAAAAWSLP